MLADKILEHNGAFVRGRTAKPLPPVEAISAAVVACYDPRLDALLLPALGLAPGEAFLFRAAGALVRPSGGSLRSLGLAVYMFGVTEVVVVGHSSCRMAHFDNAPFIDLFRKRGVAREGFGPDDLREWAGAIASPAAGVRQSMANITGAPFLPRDLAVSGFVLDDASGALELVARADLAMVTPVLEVARAPEAPVEEAAPPQPTPTDAAHAAEGKLIEDRLGAAIRGFTHTVQATARLRGEFDKLRVELGRQSNPLVQLRLIEGFARKAGADSSEVLLAFQRMEQALAAAPRIDVERGLRLLRRATGGP